jgi:hypothetical protein
MRQRKAVLYLMLESAAIRLRLIRLANWARRAADSLLPALFLALMIGSLFAGSYAVAHHMQVASR